MAKIILLCGKICSGKTFYANQIKNSVATILRSESVGAPTHYTDNKLPVYPNKKNITSIVMPVNNSDLSSAYLDGTGDYYILTVVGGTATI
jgi:hypothetical protein